MQRCELRGVHGGGET